MRKIFLSTTLMIITSLVFSSARAESGAVTKTLFGTVFSDPPPDDLTGYSGPYSYSPYQGATYTGFVDNGIFYVTNSTSDSGSSYDSYSYKLENGHYVPESRQYGCSGSTCSGYANYQVTGNSIITEYRNSPTGPVIQTNVNNYDGPPMDSSSNPISSHYTHSGGNENSLSVYENGNYQFGAYVYYNSNQQIEIFSLGRDEYRYTNGRISGGGMMGDQYKYNYDSQTGQLVSKTCYFDCNGKSIVETYVYDGDKFQVCDSNGNNCSEQKYDSLEEYIISPYAQYNIADLFDINFGTIGYVPDRLKNQNNGGSGGITGNFTGERGKRIYTIKEANEVAGKKNKLMIRYK